MRFYKFLEENLDNLIKDLQGCIAFPTLYADDGSGHPYGQTLRDCLDYMLDLAKKHGFHTGECDGHVGWCEFGEGEELIGVLSHLDVVAEGEGWTYPPYAGTVENGRIYGRGTMDDKGPAMAAFYALCAIKDSGLPLKRRIRLFFGLNEETGSADMKYYLAHGGEVPVMGFTPDGEYPIISGEKGLVTEFFRKKLSQSGDLRLASISAGLAHNIVPGKADAVLTCSAELAEKICAMQAEKITSTRTEGGVAVHAEGISAHGGMPWEGENAAGRLMCFLATLPFEGEMAAISKMFAGKFALEWDGTSLGTAMEDELSGKFTMNLGVIEGDAESLTVKLNYRYPVTKHFDGCGPIVKSTMESVGFEQYHILHKQAIYMPPESDLVQKLMKVYIDYTGDTGAEPKCIGGGTYAKMLPNTLAFGPVFPGDEIREHKPDEFMEIDRLLDNAKIFAEAMYLLAN